MSMLVSVFYIQDKVFNVMLCSKMVCITVAYVEGREEADRGTSNQPLTQVSKSVRSDRRMLCLLSKFKEISSWSSYFIKPANCVTIVAKHVVGNFVWNVTILML